MRNKYPSKSFRIQSPATATSLLFSFCLSLLNSSLHGALSLAHNGLGRVGSFVFELLGGLKGRALLAALPHDDTGNLNDTNASEEEVNGGEPKESVKLAKDR